MSKRIPILDDILDFIFKDEVKKDLIRNMFKIKGIGIVFAIIMFIVVIIVSAIQGELF